MNFVNKIFNSCCLSGLKTLPDKSVNCCVTSPPYYGLRDYGVDGQIGLEETPEAYIQKMVEVFREVWRVLRDDGTLWLNIGDSYWGGKGYSGSSAGIYQHERRKAGKTITRECSNFGGKGTIRVTDKKHESIKRKDMIGIPWMLAFALRADGWYLRQDIIWHKPNPMPESVTDRCTKAHEYIFLLSKSDKYYFDSDSIKEPQSANTHRRYSKDVEEGLLNVPNVQNTKTANRPGYKDFQKYTPKTFMQHGRNKRSVWSVSPERSKENHFAIFPQKLIEDCIKAGCPKGGIVLDPFMGSGTTAVVARKHLRNYVGFELNANYIEIAEIKLKKVLGLFE